MFTKELPGKSSLVAAEDLQVMRCLMKKKKETSGNEMT